MLINFYCFTSHVYYFRLEIYDKTIIEFSLWFSPLELYNKTIIGFGFCDMQNYQCLGKSYIELYRSWNHAGEKINVYVITYKI